MQNITILNKNEIKEIVLMIKALNKLNFFLAILPKDHGIIGKIECSIDRLLDLIEKSFEKDFDIYGLRNDYKYYKEEIDFIFQEVLEKYSNDEWLMEKIKNDTAFDVLLKTKK